MLLNNPRHAPFWHRTPCSTSDISRNAWRQQYASQQEDRTAQISRFPNWGSWLMWKARGLVSSLLDCRRDRECTQE